MGKNKELLLIYASMDSVTLNENVNIMLTPQFYTLKKEALPVKYKYQAKKIAPSLFDGLLEEGGNYSYAVSKEEDTWAFIAYDIEKIITFLSSKGIEASKVSKLFFAQDAAEAFRTPLALNEKEGLVLLDDTVVVVPRVALGEEEVSLAFDNRFTPKGGVSLAGATSSLLSKKQALSIATVLMLFSGMFVTEGLRYGGENKEANAELEGLYESYPTLHSSYARQGIVEKYRTIDKIERSKRDAIKAFSDMIFKGVTLTSLHVDEKGFHAEFSCINNDVTDRVKALAKKSKYTISKVKGSNNLLIEGLL